MKIILKNGEYHELDGVELRMLRESYPRIDVDAELRKMAEWCRANPQRRKTQSGIKRFITNWLNRTPERKERATTFAAAHKPFEPEKPKVMTKEVGKAGIQALKEALRKNRGAGL